MSLWHMGIRKVPQGCVFGPLYNNTLWTNKGNMQVECKQIVSFRTKQMNELGVKSRLGGCSWVQRMNAGLSAAVQMSTYVKRKRILTHLNKVSRLNLPGYISETVCLNSLGFSRGQRHQCCIELCRPVGHSPLGRHCCCHTSQQDLSAARREGVWFHRTSLLTQGSLTVTYARGDWSVREKICVSAHISSVLLPWKPSQLKQYEFPSHAAANPPRPPGP